MILITFLIYIKLSRPLEQWRNFVPGCSWVPVAQSAIDAPGEVILGTIQLTQGCNAEAWVAPKPGCLGFAHPEPIGVTPLH